MDATLLISPEWREQNALLHQKSRNYGSAGGMKHWKAIRNLLAKHKVSSVLDYGCGKASLKRKLRHVQNYDPAIPEYAGMPDPADVIACVDVLEHIEPACMDSVLEHIEGLMLKAGYFVIACRPAHQSLPDGRNTHCSVHPKEWWLERLGRLFDVEQVSSGDPEELICIVTKR